MKRHLTRRSFLATATAAVATPAVSFIQSLRAEAGMGSRHDLDSLIALIFETPRERCVEVIGEELRRGLSYRQFLGGMFHTAIRHGGAHEIAMMCSAFRISGELPIEESPLPLFWALDSLARRIDNHRPFTNPWFRKLPSGTPPAPGKALGILNDAIRAEDEDTAELAAMTLAKSIGNRQTIELVWKYACRDSDDLGHKVIACANAWRTMDVVGWEHAELPLRYLMGRNAKGTDNTFGGCQERAEVTLPKLPHDWCSGESDRAATLELHEEIRAARTNEAADLVCQQLISGKVKAGSVWDAVHLSAAELLLRNKKRSRGWPVHAVTSSNALHFSFRTVLDNETRLLFLLQAVSRISDQMTRQALEKGNLRDIRIRDLERADIRKNPHDAIEEIFAMLPKMSEKWDNETDRDQDERACRMAFALLSERSNRIPFMHATRKHLIQKATWNAHDMKFPAAAFEDTGFISETWRPHFLAATVHAIQGPQSEDTPVFAQAREVLASI